jgi:tetratricopeptide (TPR) repeat protein
VQNKVRQEQPGQKPQEIEQRTYDELGKQLGLDAATLKEQLPRFAEELKKAPNTTTYERANAAYVAKEYNEAERLALAAADEAEHSSPAKNAEAIRAFELAGWAAEKRIEYADALKRLRDAEALTDRTRDPLEWARIQFAIASVLQDQGQHSDAERVLREALMERARVLGPEHPDTILTRHWLAVALDYQGKNAEAEAEYLAVFKLEEQVLGPEHVETLATRSNLTAVLLEQGKYADAEAENQALIKLEEKVVGPEHPRTLIVRNNLAVILRREEKAGEAEAEGRAVIKLEEKVLGPEHFETLSTCFGLARCLNAEGAKREARELAQRAADGARKVLGPDHPDTKKYEELLEELVAKED